MARRRLAPPPYAAAAAPGAVLEAALGPVPRAEPAPADSTVPRAERPAAPIARVAAEAAAAAALEEMAETLRAAREEGRLVLDLPLGVVVADHLARDRIAPGDGIADEDMAALAASIRAHGQRTPIEVTALAPGKDGPRYGLVSGWRRLAALAALQAETGEARFSTVRALVLRPGSAEDAYLAMVEENEIRLGLSQYERARIALLAAERGVFPDPEAALRALFATASKAKLSRIRAFLELVRGLDQALRFPRAIPERLGLRLVERLREGQGARIAAALAAAAPATPEAETALLARLAAPPRAEAPAGPPPEPFRPGVTLALSRRRGALTLTLSGRGVTESLETELRAALAGLARPSRGSAP